MSRSRGVFSLIGVMLLILTFLTGNAFALTTENKDDSQVYSLSDGAKVSAFLNKWAVTPGDTFTVKFSIYGVDDFYGASLDLKFDNNLLEVVSADGIQPGDIFDGLNPLYGDYNVTIPLVAGEYDGEDGLTIGDVNAAGVINFVAHLLGNTDGLDGLNDGNWHSFVDITFKVKDNIESSYFNGKEYLPIQLLFQDTLPDSIKDSDNGTAVVKLANSEDDLEGGLIENKITYNGLPVGGIILPSLLNDQYRAVLEWDWTPDTDAYPLDAHMLVPDGDEQIDVTIGDHSGSLTESPYAKWIGDFWPDPAEGRNYFIPVEVVTLSQTLSGTYDFFVVDCYKEKFNGVTPKVTFYDSNGVLKDGDGVEASYDFNSAQNIGKGSRWDVFGFSSGQIQHKNTVVVVQERKVNIVLPGEPDNPEKLIESVQTDNQYSTSFIVTLETENFESLSSDDVKVRMFDRFNAYEGEYVSGPNDGSFQFEFSGVQAGNYHIAAKVQDVYCERENIIVDGFESKPVAYEVTPWVVPTGYDYYGIGLRGYGLDILDTNSTVVKLVNPDNPLDVVATTAPEEDEDWQGVKIWDEGDYKYMDIQLRAVGDTIPPGEYDVVITDTNWDVENPVWVPEIGNRFDLLKVTEEPALRGDAYPWVLGAGEDNYSLWFEGINLKPLVSEESGDITVELLDDKYGAGVVVATATTVAVGAQDIDNGWIRADFTNARLADDKRVYPVVKYSGEEGNIVLGGNRFEVEVADYPVVYGLEKDRVIPGKTSYNLKLRGWNLEVDKEYAVAVFGLPGSNKPLVIMAETDNNSYDLPFILETTDPLDRGGYNIEVYEVDSEQYIGNAWLHAEPAWIEAVPRDVRVDYEPDTSITLNEGIEFDIWSESENEELAVWITKDGDESVSYNYNFNDIQVTNNQVIIPLPADLTQGSYRLELFREGIIIVESRFDVYADPFIEIEAPASITEEEGKYSADFDITIRTDNIDFDNMNPDEIKVQLYSPFRYYDEFTIKSGPDEYGDFVISFTGVEAGNYEIEAWVRGGYCKAENVVVQSYDNKPVAYYVTPWAVPTGNKYYGIGFLGYGLESLKNGTIVELRDKDGDLLATSQGIEQGVKIWPESDYQHMEVQLKAVGETIPSDEDRYDLVITNTNWVEEIGKRYENLFVTDKPALGRSVYPWVLGAGVTKYSLRFEGINLNKLSTDDIDDIVVELWNDDRNEVVAASDSIEVEADNMDWGLIIANFSTTLPTYNTVVHPIVKYEDDDEEIPGVADLDIWVTEDPVVYGLENERVIPGESSYNLKLKGWNLYLNEDETYQIKVFGPDNFEWEMDGEAKPDNNTDLPFNLNLTAALKPGGYNIEVSNVEGNHIGNAWLNAEIPWVSADPSGVPVGYQNTKVVLNGEKGIWLEDDPLVDIWLIKDNGSQIGYYPDKVTEDQVIFTLAGTLQQGNYDLEVRKGGIVIAQSRFDVYKVDIKVYGDLVEGDDLSTELDVTITTENIDLTDFDPDRDTDVWVHGQFKEYRGKYDPVASDPNSGEFIFHFSGVQAGRYNLSARIRNGFAEQEVCVASYENKPVIYQVQPKELPAGNKYFGFQLLGYNLAQLNSDSVVVELLYGDGSNMGEIAATTEGNSDEGWLGISFDFNDPERLKVDMKASEARMPAGSYELRITDGIVSDPHIVRLNSVKFTEDTVLTGIEPYRLGAGAEGFFVKVHGINLDKLDSADLSVHMESKDENVIWSATTDEVEILDKDGGYGYIRAEFSDSLPKSELDIRVTVKNDGTLLRETDEIWAKTTKEPVIYGVTPALVSPGKTSYSFTLNGWNLNASDLNKFNWIDVKGPNVNMSLQDYPLTRKNENELQFVIDLGEALYEGHYEISLNDASQSYPGKHVGTVGFDARPGKISVSPDVLNEGYADTPITITDVNAGYIWDEGESLDIMFMESNGYNPPISEVNATITNIVVNDNTIVFTLGSGLPENTYLVEVLRNDILIGKGAQIQVKDAFPSDTTPPEIHILYPINESVLSTVYPTICFAAIDHESVISSVYVSLDDIEWTGSINQSNHTYSFTPEEELDEGDHLVYVKVETEAELFAEKSWMFTVDPSSGGGIEIIPDSLSGGVVGEEYDQEIDYDGGSTPVMWSLTRGSLPNGLKLDSVAGRVYGTPTQSGEFIFWLRVTDSEDRYDEKGFCLYFEEATPALAITTSSLPDAIVGESYSAALSASGGIEPYTWSIIGDLPDGLYLDADTGVISGIPTESGSFSFIVRVTDDGDMAVSDEAIVSIKIETNTSVDNPTISIGSVSGSPGSIVNVSVTVDQINDMAGISFNLIYDPNVAIVKNGGVTLGSFTSGFNLQPNYDNANNGSIRIVMASGIGKTGAGTICNIQFELKGQIGDMTDLTLDSLIVKDSQPQNIPVDTQSGRIQINRKYGDINYDTYVDFGDAIMALQYDAGLRSLSPEQIIIGDVSGDGYVDFGDAILILQYDAGLRSSFPVEGRQ